MNAHELALVSMRQCARCHCAFPVEDFYMRAGHRDSYCRQCRKIVNNVGHRETENVSYHLRDSIAYPTATRTCERCHYTYANFGVLWPTNRDICAFCYADGGK